MEQLRVSDTFVANRLFEDSRPQILFIDDDQRILDTLGKVLLSFGYGVCCQSDSTTVMDIIFTREFDLVLTDLKMSGPSGFDVLKAVRQHQSNTPVVILTGYASLYSAIEALQAGAYDYLMKPCNIQEMHMTIERGIRQKRIKQERDHYLKELQVKNLHLEQAMAQLSEAHQKLKVSEEFRETMVSMFTHDIFNPVTTIKGFVNILSQDWSEDLDDNSKQYFLIIQRNIKKLELLLQTFQSLYKIDSQTYRIHRRPVDLRAMAEEAVKNVELFCMEKDIRMVCSFPPQSLVVNVDSMELERAVSNILLNAIKYSPRKTDIEVNVVVLDPEDLPEIVKNRECTGSSEREYWVRLDVRDHGIGIDQDELSRVFTKRFRGRNAEGTEGSGIGLFICKFIVELHDGLLSASSAEGQGSIFSLFLPLQHAVDGKPV